MTINQYATLEKGMNIRSDNAPSRTFRIGEVLSSKVVLIPTGSGIQTQFKETIRAVKLKCHIID